MQNDKNNEERKTFYFSFRFPETSQTNVEFPRAIIFALEEKNSMDFAVPDSVPDVPVSSRGANEPSLTVRASPSCHADILSFQNALQEKRLEELKYLDEMGATRSLGALLAKVLRDRPEDPLNRVWQDLRGDIALSLPASVEADPRAILRNVTGAEAEYVAKHKLQVVVYKFLFRLFSIS